jgi:hypothetical protein
MEEGTRPPFGKQLVGEEPALLDDKIAVLQGRGAYLAHFDVLFGFVHHETVAPSLKSSQETGTKDGLSRPTSLAWWLQGVHLL